MKILSISLTFPSSADPSRGVFVKERLHALSMIPGVDLRVVSPTPWFPPIKWFPKWYNWSQYPRKESIATLPVERPRYVLPPKVGGYAHPQLIDLAVKKKLDRIRDEWKFDVIDAHWAYPAGAWAAKLGRRYGVPVIITGRGEDMVKFPSLPIVGNKIRWALKNSSRCIGVSREISELMKRNGAEASTVHTIPNGIDGNKFFLKDQLSCRTACSLPAERRILLSVGDRLELKGFHLIVDAIAIMREKIPDILYVIVGGPGRFGRDFTPQIQSRIDEQGLSDHVRLAGPQPHQELVNWYNSADLYVMMSSREGSPNVLLESLACGTPAVGTAVGGIKDELSNETFGRLIGERSAESAAAAILSELAEPRSRSSIAEAMKERTWEATAAQVHRLLKQVLSNGSV